MTYETIQEIKEANLHYAKENDRAYWFDESTMNFFNTEVVTGVLDDRFFITSETPSGHDDIKYTVRAALPTGRIETVGPFHGYSSVFDAKLGLKAANKWAL